MKSSVFSRCLNVLRVAADVTETDIMGFCNLFVNMLSIKVELLRRKRVMSGMKEWAYKL